MQSALGTEDQQDNIDHGASSWMTLSKKASFFRIWSHGDLSFLCFMNYFIIGSNQAPFSWLEMLAANTLILTLN